MIRICDAIMGSGKSSAAITYMNEHPEKKFIYLSPFTDEDKRIRMACPEMHFVEPSVKAPGEKHTKTDHTNRLIKEGRNIASTHQAFLYYTDETIAAIKDAGYTLIIDESVSVIEETKNVSTYDLDILAKAGILNVDGDAATIEKQEYKGKIFHDLFRIMASRNLCYANNEANSKTKHFFWLLPKDLLESFTDVFVLTYLFEAQDLFYYMKMNHMEFKYIGITHRDGVYRFSDTEIDIPQYVTSIRDKIHICEHKKLNSIGEGKHALSINWFKTHPVEAAQLKKHVLNYFNNLHSDTPADRKLWSTFKKSFPIIKGKGYTKRFLVFNSRATNEYQECNVLAYVANVFCNGTQRSYLVNHGIEVDEDAYALSNMIQWIWRSAIRNGEEIWLYLPSARMRRILNEWMDDLSNGVTLMHQIGEVIS